MWLLSPLAPNFEAALRDVTSKKLEMRVAAAQSLATPPEGSEAQAIAALRPLADDPAAQVRFAAIAALGRLGDRESLAKICERFDDEDPGVRQVAVIAAAQVGRDDERAIEKVRRALLDERPEVRFQAASSFAELAPDEAATALVRLTRDDDEHVRAHAAEVLGELGDPAATDALVPLLRDAVYGVRADAAIALARLGDGRGASVLREALGDAERTVPAATALGELGIGAAREDLRAIADRLLAPLAFRAVCAAALVRLGDPDGVPLLRKVLRAWRSDARSYAAQLAGELQLAELAPDVVRLVRRPRGADPAVVEEALERLAEVSEDAKQALAELRADKPETT